MASPRYRIGYCTSGLAHHRLDEALRLLAGLGYRGVFLTLDVGHLDPMADDSLTRAESIGRLLRTLDLEAVVETGARFILDPARKHWPTLVSATGGERREEFLARSIAIAAALGSRVVSFWSGAADDGTTDAVLYDRFMPRLTRLLDLARRHGVILALEPEPGMYVETVRHVHEISAGAGHPPELGLSLDCGHLLVTGEGEPHDVILSEARHLRCVAIEDMRRGIHEHLPFGQGDLDLPPLLRALDESGFTGVVAVELGRHSHDGPAQARRARDVLLAHGVPFGGS